MNKNELNNINESLKRAAVNYYYDNNYDVLQGMQIICSSLNYLNYYNIVNKSILEEMQENKKINYITLSSILLLIESIEENNINITSIIKDHDIKAFIEMLDMLNDEIKYINSDTYKSNCNKLKLIYSDLN